VLQTIAHNLGRWTARFGDLARTPRQAIKTRRPMFSAQMHVQAGGRRGRFGYRRWWLTQRIHAEYLESLHAPGGAHGLVQSASNARELVRDLVPSFDLSIAHDRLRTMRDIASVMIER
jgi:hypothetical protein